MKIVVSLLFSLVSIAVAIVVIFYYGKGNGLVGSGWILSVIGAPFTFLNLLFYKLYSSFTNNFIVVLILYILQYQFLAYLSFKYFFRIGLVLLLSVVIIIPSAFFMWYLCVGKYSLKTSHPVYGYDNKK